MNITHPIGKYKTGTFAITRSVAPTVVLGRRVAGSTSTVMADLSIQPLTGRQLQALPVARHSQDVRKIWTITELYTVRPGFDADTFLINGEVYEVFQVKEYPRHFACLAARQTTP